MLNIFNFNELNTFTLLTILSNIQIPNLKNANKQLLNVKYWNVAIKNNMFLCRYNKLARLIYRKIKIELIRNVN